MRLNPNGLGLVVFVAGLTALFTGWIVIAVFMLALWVVIIIPALNTRLIACWFPRMPQTMFSTSSITGNGSILVVIINGVRHEVQGSNISVVNDQICVDGKLVETGELKGIVEIKFEGDLASIQTTHASVTCTGSVDGSVDAGGSVTCGDIGKNVDAGGSVTCQNIGGNVDTGGSVNCGKISGDVDAGGSVRMANGSDNRSISSSATR